MVKNQFSTFDIFQKNERLNLKLPKMELNSLKLSKIEFSIFFVIRKIKN